MPQTPLVKIVSDTQLAIARYGTVAKMRVVSGVRGDSRRSRPQLLASQPSRVRRRWSWKDACESDRLILTHRTAGKETTTQLPWSADQGGFFAVEEIAASHPHAAGRTTDA